MNPIRDALNAWFASANAYILMPAIGAALLALVPIGRRAAAYIAMLVALTSAGGVLGVAYRFDAGKGLQHATDKAWIPAVGARYHVAIDGLSLAMMAVTALVLACAIGYALWDERGGRTRGYFALMLLLEAALMLLFTARDLLLFYVGFEAMLIPLYFLVAVWGGPGRRAATLKFVLYTVIGTLLMLVGMIWLALQVDGGPSFAYADVAGKGNTWVFLAFVVAFAIKSPIWPFHGWVGDAYRQAPPEVAAVLSGVASKAGAYGLLAIVLPIFPSQLQDWRWVLIALGTVGLLYGSLLAFRQPDGRGVIAYSSIGQMGLITLGIALATQRGATGATLQMVNHALVSASREGRPESRFIRLLPSKIANWLLRRVTGCTIRDMGGFKCLRGDVVARVPGQREAQKRAALGHGKAGAQRDAGQQRQRRAPPVIVARDDRRVVARGAQQGGVA